jgi:hypothetical protein
MHSAEFVAVEVQPDAASEYPIRWGLIVAVGLSLAFWAAVIAAVVLFL